MCFNVNVDNLDITLCGEKVIHVDSETYLGVSLKSDITDQERSHKQNAPFIKKVTM